MNRAQKAAWFGFLWCLAISVLFTMVFAALFLSQAYLRVLWAIHCVFFPVFLVTFVWVYRKKQTPPELDYDERDSLISRRAVSISFVGFCLLIYISDALLMLWESIKGTVPTATLPVIHLEVGIITVAIYYAAMIVLYGKGNKTTEGGAA